MSSPLVAPVTLASADPKAAAMLNAVYCDKAPEHCVARFDWCNGRIRLRFGKHFLDVHDDLQVVSETADVNDNINGRNASLQ